MHAPLSFCFLCLVHLFQYRLPRITRKQRKEPRQPHVTAPELIISTRSPSPAPPFNLACLCCRTVPTPFFSAHLLLASSRVLRALLSRDSSSLVNVCVCVCLLPGYRTAGSILLEFALSAAGRVSCVCVLLSSSLFFSLRYLFACRGVRQLNSPGNPPPLTGPHIATRRRTRVRVALPPPLSPHPKQCNGHAA